VRPDDGVREPVHQSDERLELAGVDQGATHGRDARRRPVRVTLPQRVLHRPGDEAMLRVPVRGVQVQRCFLICVARREANAQQV
jgi:hypothetical protein